jgi:hypothetical protein
MRPMEEATFAKQGAAVCRADFPQGRPVLHPVDSTVGLQHRRAQTAAHIGRHMGQLLRLPGAGLELTRFDSGDRLEETAQGGLGDLTTIEAALRARIGLQGKLARGPDPSSRADAPLLSPRPRRNTGQDLLHRALYRCVS